MLEIGIIGLGAISKAHAEAFAAFDNIEFVAAADIDAEKRELYKNEYSIKGYADYKQMIQIEQLDAVVIALPHGLHKEAAIFCAEHGVHILLEKPMANTVSDCEDMIKSVKENNVKFMIGHIQRYFSENIAAKEILKSEKLGKLAFITEIRTGNYFTEQRPKWFLSKNLAGGGIVMNYGGHSFDKLIWILDSGVKKISAKSMQHIENIEVDGSAQILAEFENGVTASISFCGYNVIPQNETTFYFTNGIMKLCTGVSLSVGVNNSPPESVDICDKGDSFKLMWRDFIEAIEKNTRIELDEYYGLEVIRLIEQVYTFNQIFF